MEGSIGEARVLNDGPHAGVRGDAHLAIDPEQVVRGTLWNENHGKLIREPPAVSSRGGFAEVNCIRSNFCHTVGVGGWKQPVTGPLDEDAELRKAVAVCQKVWLSTSDPETAIP